MGLRKVKMGRIMLNLQKPENPLKLFISSKAKLRLEKKREIDADPGAEKDYQITDFFINQCGLEDL